MRAACLVWSWELEFGRVGVGSWRVWELGELELELGELELWEWGVKAFSGERLTAHEYLMAPRGCTAVANEMRDVKKSLRLPPMFLTSPMSR